MAVRKRRWRKDHLKEKESLRPQSQEGAPQSDLCFFHLVILLVVNCEGHPWFWLSLLLLWFSLPLCGWTFPVCSSMWLNMATVQLPLELVTV